MSGMFDAEVNRRRRHTRWARVDLVDFLRSMTLNPVGEFNERLAESYSPLDGTDRRYMPAKISVRYVESRFWWTVEWIGADGDNHIAEAQELQLALWRAAEMESRAEARQAGRDQSRIPGGSA